MSGQCAHIATGGKLPPSAKIFNYMSVMTSRTPLKPRVSAGVFVVATRAPKDDTDAERTRIHTLLDTFAASTRRLLDEDATVLDTMRFRQGVLVEADRRLARYFKYVRSFPCAHPLDP